MDSVGADALGVIYSNTHRAAQGCGTWRVKWLTWRAKRALAADPHNEVLKVRYTALQHVLIIRAAARAREQESPPDVRYPIDMAVPSGRAPW